MNMFWIWVSTHQLLTLNKIFIILSITSAFVIITSFFLHNASNYYPVMLKVLIMLSFQMWQLDLAIAACSQSEWTLHYLGCPVSSFVGNTAEEWGSHFLYKRLVMAGLNSFGSTIIHKITARSSDSNKCRNYNCSEND